MPGTITKTRPAIQAKRTVGGGLAIDQTKGRHPKPDLAPRTLTKGDSVPLAHAVPFDTTSPAINDFTFGLGIYG